MPPNLDQAPSLSYLNQKAHNEPYTHLEVLDYLAKRKEFILNAAQSHIRHDLLYGEQ